jgi:hypothetical protein
MARRALLLVRRAPVLAGLLVLVVTVPALAGQNVLTWRDTSSTEKTFQIARKVGPCSGSGTWYIRVSVGANVTTYTDTGLTVGQVYCYKVRAVNSSGISAYSNQAEGAAKPSCGTLKTLAPDGTVTYTWVCH